MATDWMAGAVKRPGALKAKLGVPAGKTIPAAKLTTAAAKPGLIGQEARLAQTFSKTRK